MVAQLNKNLKLIRCLSPLQDGHIIDLDDKEQIEHLHHSAQLRAQRNNLEPNIIDDAMIMTSQVGGKSILTSRPNFVLKPVQNGHRGLREMVFYEFVTVAKSIFERIDYKYKNKFLMLQLETLPELLLFHLYQCIDRKWYEEIYNLYQLSEFLVDYHGVVNTIYNERSEQCSYNSSSSPATYIILTDETIGFEKPCIMDLKIGTVTYEPNAKPSKKDSQRKKYPQQAEFGFRIVGAQIYDPYHPDTHSSDGYLIISKIDGRNLTSKDSIVQAFQMFFKLTSRCNKGQRDIVQEFLEELMRLRKWFLKNESFAFYASSLLLIYEGDAPKMTKGKSIKMKMIDFAHVRKHDGIDSGFLHGLDVIYSIFMNFLRTDDRCSFRKVNN